MKLLRTLIAALATVIVAGTVASATPGFRAAFDVEPTEEVSPSPEPSPEVSAEPTVSPEPTETPSPSPSPTETSSPEGEVEDGSAAPDFSACVGLTGLENAICRHEALLALHPENPGLANALEHLTANLAKHAGAAEEPPAEEPSSEDAVGGTSDETVGGAAETTSCPGKSCEPHGNGHGNGGGHGHGNGHAKH